MKTIQDAAHKMSEELAGTKGVFPNWEKSIYGPAVPMRNAALTNVAPTGEYCMHFFLLRFLTDLFHFCRNHFDDVQCLRRGTSNFNDRSLVVCVTHNMGMRRLGQLDLLFARVFVCLLLRAKGFDVTLGHDFHRPSAILCIEIDPCIRVVRVASFAMSPGTASREGIFHRDVLT